MHLTLRLLLDRWWKMKRIEQSPDQGTSPKALNPKQETESRLRADSAVSFRLAEVQLSFHPDQSNQ